MPVIEVKNLTHIYMPGSPFETRALDGVNLHIEAGEFIGIIGHTGSGKSTLISYFNALEHTAPGCVFVNGADTGDKKTNLAEVRRGVGLVFQYPEYQLFEETVEKDIAFGPKNQKLTEDEINERVNHAMEMLGLDAALREQSPFNLSGGQKRRVAIAGVLGLSNDMPLTLGITIVSAVLLLRTGQNTRIRGDAAIAMISVGSLAIGYLLMNLFSKSSNLSGDVCSTLFGSTSILTLTISEVWLCAALSAIVVALFVLLYNKIFAVTFDENFARAVGTRAEAYNLLIAITTAVVIVLAMNLVGSLLISALVIFPALSAMQVYKNFRAVTICSAVLSVCCTALGILMSILAGTPVGATIVAVDIAAFIVFAAVKRIAGGR